MNCHVVSEMCPRSSSLHEVHSDGDPGLHLRTSQEEGHREDPQDGRGMYMLPVSENPYENTTKRHPDIRLFLRPATPRAKKKVGGRSSSPLTRSPDQLNLRIRRRNATLSAHAQPVSWPRPFQSVRTAIRSVHSQPAHIPRIGPTVACQDNDPEVQSRSRFPQPYPPIR